MAFIQPCRRQHQTGTLACFLILLLVTGCGVGKVVRGEIQPPRVSFQDLQVGLPSGGAWPFTALLILENPNPEPLHILGYDCQLWLEEQPVAQARGQEAVYLQPQGRQQVAVPIRVQMQPLLGVLPSLLSQRQVRYRLAGGFRLSGLLAGLRVPFQFQGRVTPQEGMDFLRPYLK